MQKLPEEISMLVQWMGQLKAGPLRLFLQLDQVVQHLQWASTEYGQLTEKKATLAESVEKLKREEGEWKQAIQTIRDKMTEEQEHGRQNIAAFREERAKILREEETRVAHTQAQYVTAKGQLDTVQADLAQSRHDLAAIKSDVAERLKRLQDVAT